jgi:hypothetical protein
MGHPSSARHGPPSAAGTRTAGGAAEPCGATSGPQRVTQKAARRSATSRIVDAAKCVRSQAAYRLMRTGPEGPATARGCRPKRAWSETTAMPRPEAARGEVGYGAEFFRWFAEEAVRVAGRWAEAPDGATRLVTMRRPVGPALLITPWNFPLAMGTRKIGTAVAAGCTMVVKPATQTPLSMLALADLLREAGLPAGVLNVLTTTRTAEVVEPLIRYPRLRKPAASRIGPFVFSGAITGEPAGPPCAPPVHRWRCPDPLRVRRDSGARNVITMATPGSRASAVARPPCASAS